jgi:hypothetical protein
MITTLVLLLIVVAIIAGNALLPPVDESITCEGCGKKGHNFEDCIW